MGLQLDKIANPYKKPRKVELSEKDFTCLKLGSELDMTEIM